jgi:hypothetical protein
MSSSRRDFLQSAASTGAVLALPSQRRPTTPRGTSMRSLFFNFSHQTHEGHEYFVMVGKYRYRLTPTGGRHPVNSVAFRRNRFLQMLPEGSITHVAERIAVPPNEVVLGYTLIDPDVNTGTYKVASLHLLPPITSFAYAYRQARRNVSATAPLPLSAKRKKYGLAAAVTLRDLIEEQDLLDTTTFATALANLHPELLSADPNSAAHIQTNHIQAQTGGMDQLISALESAPPADPTNNSANWGTLVPYTQSDGVTPLIGQTGNNKGLIVYDIRWNPVLKDPYIKGVVNPALKAVKNDTTLGADVTSVDPTFDTGSLQGRIWNRNDGVSSIDQSPGLSRVSTEGQQYVLSNATPSFNGYSLSSAVTFVSGSPQVVLTFKNWYVRWLGLFIQFYDGGGNVVPASQVPGISADQNLDTSNNELYLGPLTPEFTILGIPVQSSGNTATFNFPTGVATSAKILASGLGYGSHTNPDTETFGVTMTSIFNLSLPALLLGLGIAGVLDVCMKQVVIPNVTLIATEFATGESGGTPLQEATIFWRAIVTGLTNPTGPLKIFLTEFGEFLAESEVTEALTDAIPIVGAILQAIGTAGALATLAETSVEVALSPWTYVYDLVGTYDLSVTLNPGSPSGFPASAATYKVTAIFDNGVPQVQTLNMPGSGVQTLPPVVFQSVPLGGKVVLSVGFYDAVSTEVGHGATGSLDNSPSTPKAITITQIPLPLGPGVLYHHKQKTTLDSQGNHVWACAPAPATPANVAACQPNPGQLCALRDITYNPSQSYVGYAWQSYSTQACTAGGAGQLDQIANIPSVNDGANAQTGYATIPCGLQNASHAVYDPLGRAGFNYYVDTTNGLNVLRQIQLTPPSIADPRADIAWGKFSLAPDDLLLHPSGAVISINSSFSRMESLRIPSESTSDANAGLLSLANVHAGPGTRPGLFDTPTVGTITAEGAVLVVEAGNNRIHAIDAAGNPLRLFTKQPEPYFLYFSATGGAQTIYLDIAVEFSGFIYVLSVNASVYRLDIYHSDQGGTEPITTTMNFNAAKLVVDYWRNVYSLNYEVLTVNGALPPSGVTEPSISQWIPTTPPPCEGRPPHHVFPTKGIHRPVPPRRPLRRRDLWRYVPGQ